jgi:Ca2+-transporting ATPase
VSREWHTLSPAEVLALLGVEAEAGLSAEEARRRFARVGPNAVGEHPEAPLWRLRLAQFRSLVTRRPLGTMSLSAADWSVVTLSILCPVLLPEMLKAAQPEVRRR